MGRRGPQSWHEKLAESDQRLLAHIHAALERGEDVEQMHARLELGNVVSVEALRKYARKFAPANPQVAEVGNLVQTLVAEYPDLSETERMLLAVLVDKALTTEKGSTAAGITRAVTDLLRVRIERRKDTRADELHQVRVALLDIQRQVKARAIEAEKSKTTDAKSKAEAYAEIARMLDEEIRKRDAA